MALHGGEKTNSASGFRTDPAVRVWAEVVTVSFVARIQEALTNTDFCLCVKAKKTFSSHQRTGIMK